MKICIFCGSSPSTDGEVNNYVNEVMDDFHKNQIELVYGGAGIGIMGALANRLINLGGKVTGVIPRRLMKKEIAHAGLSELHVVTDMHERKKMMYDLSDAFLIFPGGMGTLDELFEILTWKQLGMHNKPIVILNINHYFDHLISFLDVAQSRGLIKEKDRSLLYVSDSWSDIKNYLRIP